MRNWVSLVLRQYSETILDFFLDVLGEAIYNKALDDVKLWLTKNVENMESDYYALYK